MSACAPPEEAVVEPTGASAAIDARAGGAVSFGEATLWVPADSLAADATLGIEALDHVPADRHGSFVATRYAYELTPHGTTFSLAVPALLHVALDPAAMTARGLVPETAQLFHWREESNTYVAMAGAYDERTKTLTSAIEHFSTYVVMAQAAATLVAGPTVTMQDTVPTMIRAGSGISVRATVVPKAGTAIVLVRARYRKLQPSPQPWQLAIMQPDYAPAVPDSNTYSALVPATFLTADDLGIGFDLEYYVEATDSMGLTTTLEATPTRRDVMYTYVPGSLTLTPATVEIAAGFRRWLTVSAIDDFGAPFDVVPDVAEVSTCPAPDARSLGEIEDQRVSGILFRALAACDGWVSVTSGADQASAQIAVRVGHVERIEIFRYEHVGPVRVPIRFDGTYVVPEGHLIELGAEGSDRFGNTVPMNVAWQAEPQVGTIDATGRLYTLDSAGFGTASAELGGVSTSQWFLVLGRAWTTLASPLEPAPTFSAGVMSTARSYHTATLLPDGKVLVAGGSNGASDVASADLYDPATNAWSPVAPMSLGRREHTATLLPTGHVMVAGGISSGNLTVNVQSYNPATNTWTAMFNLRHARYRHTATPVAHGSILIAGGTLSDISAELYNPVSGTLELPDDPTFSRTHLHTATMLPSGGVLIAGGFDLTNALANTVIYTDRWNRTAAMSQNRYSHTATLLPDGRVLVTGGHNGVAVLASAALYTPATDTWAAAPMMSVARHGHTATLLPSGRVLVIGGHNGSNTVGIAEIFDPATNQWSLAAAQSVPRFAHTATLLRNGRVLLAGGRGDGATMHASAEIFFTAEPVIEPDLAFAGSTLYGAWHEPGPLANRAYVKRWTGTSWAQAGAALNIELTREATAPRLGVAGSVLHAVWREADATGLGRIHTRYWSGATWVMDAPTSGLNIISTQDAASPSIASVGTTPHVAWDEQATGARRVYVKRRSEAGWVLVGGAIGTGLDATRPSIASVGATPYVAFEQLGAGGTRALEVRRWTGTAWTPVGASVRVNPSADAREPKLVVANNTLYLTWHETFGTTTNVYVAHLVASTWVQDGGSLSNEPSRTLGSPSLAFFHVTPYVAWRERTAAGVAQILVKHWNGAAWIQNGGSLNADPARNAFAPALLLDGPTPYAAWAEAFATRHSVRIKRLQ